MRTFSDNSVVRRGARRLSGSPPVPAAAPLPEPGPSPGPGPGSGSDSGPGPRRGPRPGSRLAPRLPAALLPWAWAAVLLALYATVSVRRHLLLRTTGYDLGIFEQAVRAYARFQPPVVPLRGEGFNLLGDHFHPAIAVLAPLYRLWPSPLALLTAQAALIAVAVVPLAGWALETLGRRAAHAVALVYGLSWGVASAVAFDFHEVALAVPLVSYAVVALGRRRWRAAVLWAAPLVLIKEDLGLTVAAVGAYIAWKGPRRLGLLTAVAGLAASAVEIELLLPAFNPAGGYAHGGNLPDDARTSLLTTVALAPLDALRPDVKAVTLVLVFAPSALLALRSPLALLTVPTLAWRMLSENGFHWGTSFHYSVVLMPVVTAGLIDALRHWRTAPAPATTPGPAPETGTAAGRPPAARHIRASLATALAVTAVILPSFPLALLAQRATWRTTEHVEAAGALLARIPDGATVAASNRLVPQLTARTEVVLFPTFPVGSRLYEYDRATLPRPTAEWIVHDRRAPHAWPYRAGHWPYPPEQQLAELDRARLVYGYREVAERDGITLLRLGPPRVPGAHG